MAGLDLVPLLVYDKIRPEKFELIGQNKCDNFVHNGEFVNSIVYIIWITEIG